MNWIENYNGNFVAEHHGICLTVFFSSYSSSWKFVYDGDFSSEGFNSAEEAMKAAEEEYP